MRSNGEIVELQDNTTTNGLVPIPGDMLAKLKRANKARRRAWYRAQMGKGLDLSQAPEDVLLRKEERRRERNKRKRGRR